MISKFDSKQDVPGSFKHPCVDGRILIAFFDVVKESLLTFVDARLVRKLKS